MATTLRSKKGWEVEVRMTDIEAARLLKGGSDFVRSLKRAETGAVLSPEQRAWLHKLANEATAPTPSTPQTLYMGILTAFATAVQNKKKIQLVYGNASVTVKMYPAPASGANKGCIYVINPTTKEYYGKISPVGELIGSGAKNPDLLNVLSVFNADPVAAASQYGKNTGVCCFCARELTDERSVFYGYGPVCAETWSLPWDQPKAKKQKKQAKPQPVQAVQKDVTEQEALELWLVLHPEKFQQVSEEYCNETSPEMLYADGECGIFKSGNGNLYRYWRDSLRCD